MLRGAAPTESGAGAPLSDIPALWAADAVECQHEACGRYKLDDECSFFFALSDV